MPGFIWTLLQLWPATSSVTPIKCPHHPRTRLFLHIHCDRTNRYISSSSSFPYLHLPLLLVSTLRPLLPLDQELTPRCTILAVTPQSLHFNTTITPPPSVLVPVSTIPLHPPLYHTWPVSTLTFHSLPRRAWLT